MEIQIMTPSPPTSTNATPYTTAPSSPHRLPNFFYSAPTSPIHSLVSFHQHTDADTDTDFAFDFTTNNPPQPPSLSAADELFHGGIIKPLKPIPNDPIQSNNQIISQTTDNDDQDHFTKMFTQPPSDDDDDQDYFIKEFTQTTCDHDKDSFNEAFTQTKRGRKTTIKTRDKLSRSSSPFRISDILYDNENNNNDNNNNNKNSPTWYSKWNIKNLILFRSVSEGSARRIKDPVNKYTRITKGDEGSKKDSSFRNVESCRSRKVSAHEMHYTANRAVAEEMRRKTYLPYKSGLFGCLGLHNNGVGGTSVRQISKGITTVMKQR